MSTQTIEYQTGVPALDAATLCEAFQITARSHAAQIAVRTPRNGFTMTWGDYDERVRRTAAGLAALGVRRGDTVATMLTNRPEFHWVDVAAMHLGAQAFGLYNTSSQEQLEYVLRDADSAVVVTERVFAAKMLRAREACPLAHVVSVDGGGTLTLDEVDAGGHPGFDFDAAWQAVRSSDVVTLIYTPGTTGPPKGAQITHGAVMASVRPLQQAIPAYRSGFSAISYLPTAHAIARILQHYYALVHGGTLTCCPGVADLGATLVDARPTLFIGTPRVWEKLQAGLSAAIEADHDDQRRQAAEWGIDVGLRRVRVAQAGRRPSTQLLAEHERADALVLPNLRARLGLDRVEGAIIGASPVAPEVIEFFWALGVPLCEAYSMTEVMVATVNPTDRVKIGTVGPPVPGMELRLAADGEVLNAQPADDVGLPRPAAEDRRDHRRRRLGAFQVMSASWTRTATCGSSTGRRGVWSIHDVGVADAPHTVRASTSCSAGVPLRAAAPATAHAVVSQDLTLCRCLWKTVSSTIR